MIAPSLASTITPVIPYFIRLLASYLLIQNLLVDFFTMHSNVLGAFITQSDKVSFLLERRITPTVGAGVNKRGEVDQCIVDC